VRGGLGRYFHYFVLCIGALLLVSCSSIKFRPDNIRWAKENHVHFRVVEIDENDKGNVCWFVKPDTIFVRRGSFVYHYYVNPLNPWREIIEFRMTYKEYCLNHEIGHLREFQEGLPYHSKYAW